MESILALAMISIVTQGAVSTTSRVSASQGELRVQEIALAQMKAMLVANRSGSINLCDANALPDLQLPQNISVTPEVQGCNETMYYKINGTTFEAPVPLVLSVTSDVLGGQIVIGGTWTDSNQ